MDLYGTGDVLLLSGIFVLNIFDAFFTLRWLQLGGVEANPLMDRLLQTNDLLFLFQKCFVVGIWLLILMVHKNFRVARLGLWMLLLVYAGLLVYHFVLQAEGVPPPAAPLPT